MGFNIEHDIFMLKTAKRTLEVSRLSDNKVIAVIERCVGIRPGIKCLWFKGVEKGLHGSRACLGSERDLENIGIPL